MFNVVNVNYKNSLLNLSARYFGLIQPEYFHFEYGPSHAKVFLCICSFQRKTTSHQGRTKTEAEQKASEEMMQILRTQFVENTHETWTVNNAPFSISPEILSIIQALREDLQFEVVSLYGDAVLRYYVARYLFDKYSQFQEGVLTRITSEALRGETRADIAERLGLGEHVQTVATSRALAQSFSAVVGKCALLRGDDFCKVFIMEHYSAFIDMSVVQILTSRFLDDDLRPSSSIVTAIHNYKNELLEYAQRQSLSFPEYVLLGRTGAAHAPVFMVRCCFNGEETVGQGNTVKSAEQGATQEILTRIKGRDAASARQVGASSSGGSSFSNIKRFKAPALHELKRTIGWFHFNSLDRLQEAFTHPSKNQYSNYQRLEFLGDALLKKILFAYVLTHYPALNDKGVVSSRMDHLVSEETQVCIANTLEISQHIFTEAPRSESVLGDVLEALIAAIFLDAEENRTNNSEKVIASWFKPEVELAFGRAHKLMRTNRTEPASFACNTQRFLPYNARNNQGREVRRVVNTSIL